MPNPIKVQIAIIISKYKDNEYSLSSAVDKIHDIINNKLNISWLVGLDHPNKFARRILVPRVFTVLIWFRIGLHEPTLHKGFNRTIESLLAVPFPVYPDYQHTKPGNGNPQPMEFHLIGVIRG
jgi:hypothetical protein